MNDSQRRMILYEFASFMSEGGPPGIILDAADLPYPKQVILEALNSEIEISGIVGDSERQEWARIGVGILDGFKEIEPADKEDVKELNTWNFDPDFRCGLSKDSEKQLASKAVLLMSKYGFSDQDRSKNQYESSPSVEPDGHTADHTNGPLSSPPLLLRPGFVAFIWSGIAAGFLTGILAQLAMAFTDSTTVQGRATEGRLIAYSCWLGLVSWFVAFFPVRAMVVADANAPDDDDEA